MRLTGIQLATIVGDASAATAPNIVSIITALDKFGAAAGLDKPHRLAHYIAQLAHESGSFRYDREIWGPTAAQKRYDTRTDLGNTAVVDGDGKLYAGRGPIQVTGKANYTAYRDWCRKMGYSAPDFVANPDAINTDPWEGLSPIWYWTTRKINVLADENNIEQITKRINGGMNGFNDRVHFYVRAALVLLGYKPNDIEGFQKKTQGLGVDGDAGPKTRSAMHMALVALDRTGEATAVATPAPVVSETEVPVVPKGADKPGIGRWMGGLSLAGGFGGFFTDIPVGLKYAIFGLVVIGIVALLWRGEQIAMRAKRVIASFES